MSQAWARENGPFAFREQEGGGSCFLRTCLKGRGGTSHSRVWLNLEGQGVIFPDHPPFQETRLQRKSVKERTKSLCRLKALIEKAFGAQETLGLFLLNVFFQFFFSSVGLQLMSFLINFFNYWFLFEVLPLQWLEDFKHTLVSYFSLKQYTVADINAVTIPPAKDQKEKKCF